MRYAYYRRLSVGDRKIYRQSDSISELALPDPRALWPKVDELRRTLQQGAPAAVRRSAAGLCHAVTAQLGAPRVHVKVLGVRPSDASGELHGLYTAADDGRAEIEVWMRTAAHAQVVAFRTFLRTLLHELCHHFDLTLLGLGETFHTEGFFRRESSLFRQLEPGGERATNAQKPQRAAAAMKPDKPPRATNPRRPQRAAAAMKPDKPPRATNPRTPQRAAAAMKPDKPPRATNPRRPQRAAAATKSQLSLFKT